MNNTHTMITRSKNKTINQPPSDMDDQGNLKDLIDYDCKEPFDKHQLYEEINRLSKGRISMDLSPKKTIKKKHNSKILVEEINEHFNPNFKKKKPLVLICDTIKGKGVSFMEADPKWHHRKIKDDEYETALRELEDNKN